MKNNKRKYTLFLVCLLLTVAIAVSGTIAYIFTTSDPVTNTFVPVLPKIEIPEEMNGTVKENATVKNTGDVDSYLRAKILVTWQNSNGEVYPELPILDTHYTMLNGANWIKVGDYYYYNKVAVPGQPAVTKNETTEEIEFGSGVTEADMLIIKAEVKSKAPVEDYKLHIEILGQSIQSTPVEAVQEAWGMTYTEADGTGTWSAYAADGSN